MIADFVQEKPLIDVLSDDDSIFNRSVFDIAHPSHAGDFHVSPSETGSSITKLQVTSNAINTSTELNERMVNNNNRKTVSNLLCPLL